LDFILGTGASLPFFFAASWLSCRDIVTPSRCFAFAGVFTLAVAFLFTFTAIALTLPFVSVIVGHAAMTIFANSKRHLIGRANGSSPVCVVLAHAACRAFAVAHIFVVRRLYTYALKAALCALCCLTFAFFSACAAPSVQPSFVGTYRGESIHKSLTGRSIVLGLTITEQNGNYSLTASMNDTNCEDGTDHTSNTHWRWIGTGAIHNDRLTFRFDSGDAELARGALRRDGSGFILMLDRVEYRLRLSRHE
jgi:hypothetical protein